MRVKVRLFAQLRERAGRSEIELELPEGARVSDALQAVGGLTDGLRVVMAVNREYADEAAELHAGDELALIPPVSGGAAAVHVAVREEALSLDALVAAVRDPRAGAVVTFTGVTRDVDHLDYEGYVEMAEPAMRRIAEAAVERHGLCAAAVGDVAAGIPVVMAVNREYADEAAELRPGDELALIPPVSGGAAAVHVAVREDALSLDALAAAVRDPRAGAVVTFTGVTRDVDHLDYEGYVEMAEPAMRRIAEAAVERHGLCAAAVEHRVGRVALAEASVVVAVSAPHRGEAFAGAREIIDVVKARAPFWKREEGEWVQGSVPTSE